MSTLRSPSNISFSAICMYKNASKYHKLPKVPFPCTIIQIEKVLTVGFWSTIATLKLQTVYVQVPWDSSNTSPKQFNFWINLWFSFTPERQNCLL